MRGLCPGRTTRCGRLAPVSQDAGAFAPVDQDAGALRPSDQDAGALRPLPIVIAGHVDHGKSTFVGRLLMKPGRWPMESSSICARPVLGAVSSSNGPSPWTPLQIERDQGITIDTSQSGSASSPPILDHLDVARHKEFLKNYGDRRQRGRSRRPGGRYRSSVRTNPAPRLLLHLSASANWWSSANKMDLAGLT